MWIRFHEKWVGRRSKESFSRAGSRKDSVISFKIALDVPEEHCHINLVRQIGRSLLEHGNTSPQDIDDVEIVLGELCSNVTRHARSEAGHYQVCLEHHGDHVVVTVADKGCGFDVQHVPPVGTPRPEDDGTLRIGGFGLQLVTMLTDQVEFSPNHPTGSTVRAKRSLQPPQP